MKVGTLDLPRYRIDALCAVTVEYFLYEMKNKPEVRDKVLAMAEEIRAEREEREGKK